MQRVIKRGLPSLLAWLLVPVILLAVPPLEGATKRKKKTPAHVTRPSGNDEEDDLKPASADRVTKDLHALQPGELPLAADGAIVLDELTGTPLYEKNADAPQYPASTTKIMTALLVIESGDLDREVVVTEEDSKVPESSLEIKPGDRYTRRQMLYGLMLKSANDVAHALGRDNAGTAEAFAEKMTRRAQELGATNTSFRNPNGLHDAQHFTTPRDLALIARYAMNQPLFRRIVGTVKYSWVRCLPTEAPPGTAPEVWLLTNHNRLLTRFEGCTGVKTGYTNPAQHTLVTAALRGWREVVAVVMHDGKLQKWEDSILLLTHGLEHPPKADGETAQRN
jgi:D-alanyl-D-alanine carboxypeptidase (penicillin-binding protein 5/6)